MDPILVYSPMEKEPVETGETEQVHVVSNFPDYQEVKL